MSTNLTTYLIPPFHCTNKYIIQTLQKSHTQGLISLLLLSLIKTEVIWSHGVVVEGSSAPLLAFKNYIYFRDKHTKSQNYFFQSKKKIPTLFTVFTVSVSEQKISETSKRGKKLFCLCGTVEVQKAIMSFYFFLFLMDVNILFFYYYLFISP